MSQNDSHIQHLGYTFISDDNTNLLLPDDVIDQRHHLCGKLQPPMVRADEVTSILITILYGDQLAIYGIITPSHFHIWLQYYLDQRQLTFSMQCSVSFFYGERSLCACNSILQISCLIVPMNRRGSMKCIQ